MGISRNKRPLELGPEVVGENQSGKQGTEKPKRNRWSTTFLIAGSALLGATAVAFWNRRTIGKMKIQVFESTPAGPSEPADEEIF